MAIKKSTKSKTSRQIFKKKSLKYNKQPSVTVFLKNIWVLITFILLLLLFIKKISTASADRIQWTGWLIIVICLSLITSLAIWIYPLVEKVTGLSENQAITLIAIVLVGIVSAVAYFLWEYIAPVMISNVK